MLFPILCVAAVGAGLMAILTLFALARSAQVERMHEDHLAAARMSAEAEFGAEMAAQSARLVGLFGAETTASQSVTSGGDAVPVSLARWR